MRDEAWAQWALTASIPPRSRSQRTWRSAITIVASAGVLSVWSLRELSMAADRERNCGTHRPSVLSSTRRVRSMAAGERTATHRPPSDPRAFWREK